MDDRRPLHTLQRRAGARAATAGLLLAAAAVSGPAFAAPLPIRAPVVSLPTLGTVATFNVDLGSLPARPRIVVMAVPDSNHPNMQLQIELTDWVDMPDGPGACPQGSATFQSNSGPGVATFTYSLIGCNPTLGAFVGKSVNVKLRALSFGSGSGPTSAAIWIRGETRPPTGTVSDQVETDLGPQIVSLVPSRDTVIYADDTAASNGAGSFLWAGSRTISLFSAYSRRSLLRFDVVPLLSPVSIVDRATLSLGVTSLLGGGGALTLYRVAPSGSFTTWAEGDANAGGSEFTGVASGIPAAANWNYRIPTFSPWTNPGGDVLSPAMPLDAPGALGVHTVEPRALRDAVQDMIAEGSSQDGFMITGPSSLISNVGVQLASREHPTSSLRPRLELEFHRESIHESGTVSTGVQPFVSEGQNFRWIYDLDFDDIFVTNVGGVCEVVDTSGPQQLPYTYQFGGTPGFTGVDCCTWRIEGVSSVVGAGQALFFHNLDAANPANLPPDSDQDGIRNLCDNCPNLANGPLLGSCRTGPTLRAPCRSNAECGAGGSCSLGQEDANGDFVGDVCVPEPGVAAGLAAGSGCLALLTRVARRRER